GGEFFLEFAFLELDAEDRGEGVVVGAGVEAGDADGAGVGAAQTFDAFDGGGLAGAVGAEDPEDLSFPDGEGDVVDGGAARVGLAQAVDFDDRNGWQDGAGRWRRTSSGAFVLPSADRLMRPYDPRRDQAGAAEPGALGRGSVEESGAEGVGVVAGPAVGGEPADRAAELLVDAGEELLHGGGAGAVGLG